MSNDVTNPILEVAISYADRGWPVVPVQPKGKMPWVSKWQVNASTDSDTLIEWWNSNPQSNVGVQLGPRSGIIDIAGDEANSEEEILALFDGEIPNCPTFKSARGVHRIFQWHERLPDNVSVNAGTVEIRMGNRMQAVFPPSIHESGIQYAWLEGLTLDDVEPPELSNAVLSRWIQGVQTMFAEAGMWLLGGPLSAVAFAIGLHGPNDRNNKSE